MMARELARLGHRHESALGERHPCLPKTACARYPQNHVQVAQASRGLFHVRLEVIGAFLVFFVPLFLLELLGLEELLAVESALRFALKLAAGEIAGYLAEGRKVVPAKLLAAGFEFAHPELAGALQGLVGRVRS